MKMQTLGASTMTYQDVGQGKPLLMGHSFLWDSRMWQPQITALKSDYRCIAPDLWSHGYSDPLPTPSTTLEAITEDYWQFTQALSLKEFAVLGLSVGGMWGAHMALNYPKAVKALVLMDTFVGDEPPMTQKTYFAMMDKLAADNQFTPELADQVAPYFFAKSTAKEQPQLVKSFIQSLLEAPANHIPGKVSLGRAIFSRASILEQLSEIKVPTLIVVGEDDLPRPPRESEEMAKRIPNAQLAIIPKAGHICTLEQPKLVNEVLTEFLKKYY